ncbi:MAG TPA: hypothetical protein VIG66_03770 [Noviherbaspirillum sp.]
MRKRDRVWRRVLNTIAIFLVGGAAGVAGAWWAQLPDFASEQSATISAPDTSGASMPAAAASSLVPPSFAESESGAADDDGAEPETRPPFIPRLPYALDLGSDPAASSADGASEGKAAIDVEAAADNKEGERQETARARAKPDSASGEPQTATDSTTTGAGTASHERSDAGKAVSKGAKSPAVQRNVDRVETKKKGTSTKLASAARNSKSSSASGKRTAPKPSSREMERIRQQAADELWRKTVRERIPSSSATSRRDPASSGASSTARASALPVSRQRAKRSVAAVRAQWARCERSDGFWQRERCKWRLCGGSWGEGGCPSFRNNEEHTPYN